MGASGLPAATPVAVRDSASGASGPQGASPPLDDDGLSDGYCGGLGGSFSLLLASSSSSSSSHSSALSASLPPASAAAAAVVGMEEGVVDFAKMESQVR